ncbi:MAG: lipid II:glycine glycyltransferase FemX [Thermodesulfobacteriota bacterium]
MKAIPYERMKTNDFGIKRNAYIKKKIDDFEIREINNLKLWDDFVEKSEQGTLFSSSIWARILNKYPDGNAKIIGVFDNNKLIAGMQVFERERSFLKIMAYPPLTPFTTPIFENIRGLILLRKYLENKYHYIALQLEPSIKDINEFRGWANKKLYTYEIDTKKRLEENFSKAVRYEFRKAEKKGIVVEKSNDIEKFIDFYEETFQRQNLSVPINTDFIKEMFKILKEENKCELFMTQYSGALIVFDHRKAYYLMASSKYPNFSSSYLVLKEVIKEISARFEKLDLVGANIPRIAKFKRKFATKLVEYNLVEWYSSIMIRMIKYIYGKIR